MDRHGLEAVCFQVNQVHILLRVTTDNFRVCRRPQHWMAQSNNSWIVITNPVNCPGSQAPDKADKPVFSLYLRRPAESVSAESNPGPMGHIIIFKFFPLNFLYQDGHTFVIILQTSCSAVQEGVGVQR